MKSVYLLLEDSNNYYKIGISKNPTKRVKQLQTGSAGLITIYNIFESKYANKIERTLHRKYNLANIKGEWFELTIKEAQNFINDCRYLEDNFKLIDKTNNIDYVKFKQRTI